MIKIMPVQAFNVDVIIGPGITQTVSVVPEMSVMELKALLGTIEDYSMPPHQQKLIFEAATLQVRYPTRDVELCTLLINRWAG